MFSFQKNSDITDKQNVVAHMILENTDVRLRLSFAQVTGIYLTRVSDQDLILLRWTNMTKTYTDVAKL